MTCYFITHPEVIVDPAVPIDEWRLSPEGRERAARMADVLRGNVETIISSAERKAIDTAVILAEALEVSRSTDPTLGEMDRSATGYLPPAEFEATADQFFAFPDESVRGWERAIDAQRRIKTAVQRNLSDFPAANVAFVAHGGVGGLLLASLTGASISRDLDQPGLGSYFTFDAENWRALSCWARIG